MVSRSEASRRSFSLSMPTTLEPPVTGGSSPASVLDGLFDKGLPGCPLRLAEAPRGVGARVEHHEGRGRPHEGSPGSAVFGPLPLRGEDLVADVDRGSPEVPDPQLDHDALA